MESNWKKTSDELLRITFDAANMDAPYRTRECVIDKTLRIASNVISSKDENIGQSSPTARYGCLRWSKEAYDLYLSFRKEGMSHKQACYAKVNGKSPYINEHEYPLSIVKKSLLNGNWNLDKLKEYMYSYGSFTVVTKEEDRRLKTVTTIHEGKARYSNAGINVLNLKEDNETE
tara:strand:+ start:5417 stop:5938 length:522 start_codon:yes stop_codon:yes gene_type:complete